MLGRIKHIVCIFSFDSGGFQFTKRFCGILTNHVLVSGLDGGLGPGKVGVTYRLELERKRLDYRGQIK